MSTENKPWINAECNIFVYKCNSFYRKNLHLSYYIEMSCIGIENVAFGAYLG